jgi:hypothetical protein
MAVEHPERVIAIITQNGNAYVEGLSDDWNPIREYWKEPIQANRDALRALLTPATTYWQYATGVKDTSLVSPDGYNLDNYYMTRPGAHEAQLDLFEVPRVLSPVPAAAVGCPGATETRSSCPQARRRSSVISRTRRSPSSTQDTLLSKRTATKSRWPSGTFCSGSRWGRRAAPRRSGRRDARLGSRPVACHRYRQRARSLVASRSVRSGTRTQSKRGPADGARVWIQSVAIMPASPTSLTRTATPGPYKNAVTAPRDRSWG